MLVRIGNREDPDQTASLEAVRLLLQKQSDMSLPCLSRPFISYLSYQLYCCTLPDKHGLSQACAFIRS